MNQTYRAVIMLSPVKVVISRPSPDPPHELENKKMFIFVGPVPKDVCGALGNIKKLNKDQRVILENYYGNEWKENTGFLNVIRGGDDASEASGGAQESNIDIAIKIKKKEKKLQLMETDTEKTLIGDIEYVFDYYVNQEDNIMELKHKISLVTGINAYRQHLYYVINNKTIQPYNILLDGIYTFSIEKLASEYDKYPHVFDIPVDKHLYENRRYINIHALDTFSSVASSLDLFYVVDINDYISEKFGTLSTISIDSYEYELFYYGFIVKYWPQMTVEVFRDYVTTQDLYNSYPDLAPIPNILRDQFNAELEIIKAQTLPDTDKFYGQFNIAITSAIIEVSGINTQTNIRNIFDKLAVTPTVPIIRAYVEKDNRRYTLTKSYILNTEMPLIPINMEVDILIIAYIPGRKTPVFINIRKNGKYIIKTDWNGEDQMNFDAVLKASAKIMDPIVEKLNESRDYFINTYGNRKFSPVTEYNTRFKMINISIFWKKFATDGEFKALVDLLEDQFIPARIISQKGLGNTPGVYEFKFNKGIIEHDPYKLEALVNAKNHYRYLSDAGVKQKWEHIYSGKNIKFINRTTDLKLEIINIRKMEFDVLFTYMINFFYGASQNILKSSKAATKTEKKKAVKAIKKLKEVDPDLYNLKKYGSKKIYSKMCQKGQPTVYTDVEYSKMTNSEKANLTSYWNFTTDRPAYYGCPNKNFPNLYFIVNAHPKNYCLPCCKKKESQEESIKADITAECLEKHTYEPRDTKVSKKYIIKYGKEIEEGRFSHISPELSPVISPNKYFMYGVPQNVPAVKGVGILFAITAALDMTIKDFIKAVIAKMKAVSFDITQALLEGTLQNNFRDANDFIASLDTLFIKEESFCDQELLRCRFDQWNELFIELCVRFMGVFPLVLDEKNILISKKDVLSFMRSERFIYVFAIPSKRIYYPIFSFSGAEYMKGGARTPIKMTKIFEKNKTIETLIFDESCSSTDEDLIIQKAKGLGYFPHKYFINRRGMAYGAILGKGEYKCDGLLSCKKGVVTNEDTLADELIYVPINSNYLYCDAVPTSSEPFDRTGFNLPPRLIFGILYVSMDPNNRILAYDRKAIGIFIGGFSYYFNETDIPEITKIIGRDIPVTDLVIPPEKVNAVIMKNPMKIDYKKVTFAVPFINRATYRNNIYRLIMMEFTANINNYKNESMRKSLNQLIIQTNFKKDISNFRTEFKKLLLGYPNDFRVLTNQILEFNEHFSKQILLNNIDETVYDFDRAELTKIQKSPIAKSREIVANIFKRIIIEGKLSDGMSPNIYIACRSDPIRPSCDNDEKKLIYDEEIIGEPLSKFVEILVDDIKNPIKAKLFDANIMLDNIVDYFNFEKRPTEIITIE